MNTAWYTTPGRPYASMHREESEHISEDIVEKAY